MQSEFENNVATWLGLTGEGRFLEAKDFYFETLFPSVIENFVAKEENRKKKVDVLFSVLGFTPEPIILTQRALDPKVHIIFYTNLEGDRFERDINPYLQKFLTSQYKLVELKDIRFETIYHTLQEQMSLSPARDYALDITGGKKSMVASAAIFARDFNFNVLYVDYTSYNPDIRRPLPGTEILSWVYDPEEDLPELMDI